MKFQIAITVNFYPNRMICVHKCAALLSEHSEQLRPYALERLLIDAGDVWHLFMAAELYPWALNVFTGTEHIFISIERFS